MCLFVEKKKKKGLCLVYHKSTKEPPTLFFQPRPPSPLPCYFNPPIINNCYNFQSPLLSLPLLLFGTRAYMIHAELKTYFIYS